MGLFLFGFALKPCLQSAFRGVSGHFDELSCRRLSSRGQDSAFLTLHNSINEIGLIICSDKCEAISFVNDSDWFLADISVTNLGLSILGCPVAAPWG